MYAMNEFIKNFFSGGDGRNLITRSLRSLRFRNPRFLTLASLVVFLRGKLPFPDPFPGSNPPAPHSRGSFRRREDSNLREDYSPNSLARSRIRPLCHVSRRAYDTIFQPIF